MKIRKAYQGTVPENKILDTYSESQTDVYSCNYVNKANTYSTNEINTGTKWIDGNYIYRKVVDTGQISSQVKSVPHGISNLSSVIKLYGIAKSSAGNYYTLPRVHGSDINTQIGLELVGVNITLRTGNTANFASSFVIVEYTKSSS